MGEGQPHNGSSGDALAGRYRNLGPLGVGGMGVVYRAEDTLLGRTVALKFLPPLLSLDARARARLLAEARAASALDHPNVCTIFEVGETAAGQLYLAMACCEGETLARRLERGRLEPAAAWDIALQVARGLARAHQLAIVHRDIKPSNLMIAADGTVKILDFGIAKLPGRGAEDPQLGTPSYMSPEQARGRPVDARSDVWSLGAVLHEMLLGRPPARGGDEGARGPAGPASRELTPRARRLLARMLADNPVERYPNAGELLADLATEARAASGQRGGRFAATGAARWWLAGIAAGLALALGAGYQLGLLRGGSGAARTTVTRLTDLPGRAWFPSLSPDGKFVVYARTSGDSSRLFLQRTGGGSPLALPRESPADDSQPAFSPDGQQIAFRSERDGGGIFLMGATGEPPRRLTDFGFNPGWSPDGREVLCATEGIVNPRIRRQRSEIFRVSLASGARRLVFHGDAVQPSWSPHGRRIAFWGISAAGQREIWTISAAGEDPVRVTPGLSLDWNPVWSPDGRHLYFTSDRSGVMNLWRVAIDEGSGRVGGDPEPITTSAEALMLPSLSRDGRLIAYAADDSRSILERRELDPASGNIGPAASILQTSRIIFGCDASRDGRWLVVASSVPREDLLLLHPDGSGLRSLTRGDGFKYRQPRFSPDSARLAFYSNRSGKYDLWTLRTDGSLPVLAASIPGGRVAYPLWSPDGTRLACDIEESEALIDLSRPLSARRPERLPPPGAGLSFSATSWSADGRRLAGVLHRPDGPREPGIVVYSLGDRTYARLTARGTSPHWLSDSRRLLYQDGDGVFLLDTAGPSSRQVLAAAPGAAYDNLAVSPDDRRLYLVRSIDEGAIYLLATR